MSKVVKAVTGAVSGVVKAVVNVATSVVKAVTNVVADVINMVASPFMGLMGGTGTVPDAAAETARQDGVLIQRQGSNENIPVVYGYRKVGGKIIFAETGSTNNQYLWVAYAFSEGCVEGLNELWLDDNQLSASVVQKLNAGEIVDVTDTKYAGRVRYQWFPGVYYADPSSSTIGSSSICSAAPSWNNKMVFNGVAVLFARYEWKAITTQAEADANPFSGSIPQVQVCIMGRRIASLRSGSSGENYSYQGTGYVERYSTNPAEILLDYLRNPRYGKGLANTDIDWDSFRVAAAKCDQTITYSSSVTGPILTLNYVLDTGSTLFSNIKALLQNFRAYMPYIQGKYKLKIEDAGHPTNILSGAATISHTFDKDNIVGDITYTAIDKSSKYNFVSVNWVDPDQKWSVQQVVYPSDETTRQTYINYDGGRENSLETTLGGITNSQIALDMARLLFNKSRFQESCSFQASAEAMELEPGDNIYIKGNVLSFENVPWRIISIKMNNDYTFDIGCVRNPDFIYPYVQANTPDTVLAPYVPIGSTIKAPISGVTAPVGLYPPTRAPLPDGYVWPVNSGTNPPPTTPGGINGGGVGVSTSTQNTTPSNPTNPQPIGQLSDYVTIDRADYTYSGDTVYIDLFFAQPTNSQYKSVILWYKSSAAVETVWTQVEIVTRPGPGQTISYRIGPLLNIAGRKTYDLRTRVVYQSGEMSTQFGSAQLNASGAATQNPDDSHSTVTSGWLPISTPGVSRRDDTFNQIVAIPQLTGGNPRDPRQWNVKIQQEIVTHPANPDIVGVKVFYKKSADTYWEEIQFDFSDGTYVAGQTVTLDLTSKANLGGTTDAQDYDFIFRWAYSDGRYSSYQTRFMSAQVESVLYFPSDGGPYTAYDYDMFNYPNSIVTRYSGQNELVVDYSFQTVSQGIATGAIADPIDMWVGLYMVNTYGKDNVANNTIRFLLFDPGITAWRGVRIYYRPVTPGANPAYSTFDCISPPTNVNGRQYVDMPCVYDVEYQYVIVPLVYKNGARVNGSSCLFGQAKVHGRFGQGRGYINPYPIDGDWSPIFNWRRESTAQAIGELTTGFAQVDPTIIATSWKVNNVSTGKLVVDNGITSTIGVHYTLGFVVSHIPGFQELHIYRRNRFATPRAYNATTNPHSVDYGFWEKIVLTTAVISTATDYVNTVNLRPPTDETNCTESVPASTSTVWRTPFLALPGFYQMSYLSNRSQKGSGVDEFIFVIKSNGTMSPKALFYRGWQIGINEASYDIKNQYGPPALIDWPTTIYDSPSALGWQKKLSEARYRGTNQTPILASKLWYDSVNPGYISTAGTTYGNPKKPVQFAAPTTDTTGLGVI